MTNGCQESLPDGYLEENIYMIQPDAFITKGQEYMVCKLHKSILLVICSSPMAYTLSLYVYIHEAFIILSCYLNRDLT